MKAISPAIVTILLIVLTVGLAATSFIFIQNLLQTQTSNVEKLSQSFGVSSLQLSYVTFDVDIDLVLGMNFENWYFTCDNTFCNVTFKDVSRYENDGVFYGNIKGELKGNPKWVKGKYGYALEFDGVDDYVRIPYDFYTENSSLTWILWFKVTKFESKNWQYILNANGCNGGIVLMSDNKVHVEFRDAWCNYYVTPYGLAPELNKWYFIAVTYDNKTKELAIYINGEKVWNTTRGSHYNWGSTDIGGWVNLINNEFAGFAGLVDEVFIYSRALSDEEIKACYRDIRNCPRDDSLVLHLSFDEGKGKYVNDLSFIKKGPWGYYLKFDGSQYVLISPSIPLDFQKFSVSLKFNPTNYTRNWARLVEYGGNNFIAKGWDIEFSCPASGCLKKINFVIWNSTNGFACSWGNINLTLNRWYQIAGIYNESYRGYKYINGLLDGITQTRKIEYNASVPIIIGRSYLTEESNLVGKLDEIYLFKRALTQKEIDLLFKNISIILPITLVIYNPLDRPINLSRSHLIFEYIDQVTNQRKTLCILSNKDFYLSDYLLKPNEQKDIKVFVNINCANKILKIPRELWKYIEVRLCYSGSCTSS